MSKTIALNQESLYLSMLSGAKQVLKHKNTLNDINVFPVADGDTGSNMGNLMQSIIDRAKLSDDAKTTLESISDAALTGARGNSGIIFAQYLQGLLESFDNNKDVFTEEDLINAAQRAVPHAYEAVSNPVEGTMITLMKEWAESLASAKQYAKDLNDLLGQSLENLRDSLKNTPDKLAVLKKNNVVDSGAKGFFHFIEGLFMFFTNQAVGESFDSELKENTNHSKEDDSFENENYRYCTEALIEGDNLDKDTIKQTIEDLGDSLVVAGNNRKVRLHIHTNTPALVFDRVRTFGQITQQKADDMQRQYEMAHARKYDTALVTDSIADLPQSVIDEYQIHQMPLILSIEDTDFLDKRTITTEQMYAYMDAAGTYPKSSQPNLKEIETYYETLTNYYKNVLVLSVSSKMSGTFNVMKQAAKKFNKDRDVITVIDTKQNSGAQGLLVMRAAEMIDAGTPLETIQSNLSALREKAKILVSVKTMKYMVRSGRISKTLGMVGKVTNLKPVISIDEAGEGIIFAKGLSTTQSTRKIKSHVQSIHDTIGIERYAIVHAKADARAQEYSEKFERITGIKPTYVMDISSIVAMNAGIGTVAIAYITK